MNVFRLLRKYTHLIMHESSPKGLSHFDLKSFEKERA